MVNKWGNIKDYFSLNFYKIHVFKAKILILYCGVNNVCDYKKYIWHL